MVEAGFDEYSARTRLIYIRSEQITDNVDQDKN